ncbi:hypothetical protein EC973_004803 [Apophysomyces ossiformis]|uniref:Uncharacterized protein n=1 Tax=Apophysomyces ossiformis TaxID=679940 RepID=A0A8H7EKD6_9FUNG|nr:hypothetical protein EC973_004803 [Apophysomyces ossiformis]
MHSDFKREFEDFFVSEDICEAWWTELETTVQGDKMVSKLQLYLEELFVRLEVRDNTTCKQRFVKALHPELAYEVERTKLSSYESVVNEAKRIETLMGKY